MPMELGLEGKVAIVTGSSDGLGRACAERLSAEGVRVTVCARREGHLREVAAAIEYAADHGARVINISIGGPNPSALLQSAVDHAWAKGAAIFASAMNYGTGELEYPAACGHVIAVSATDSNDHLASFSNYGNWISLAAPGTNILTTMDGGGYGYWFGTSFSSPIVAGVAALCLAVNPSLTNAALVTLLEQTADDIGNPGKDSSFGWGRINAYRAVRAASPIPAPAPQRNAGKGRPR